MSIALILILGILLNLLFKRMHLPALVGYLLLGIVFGPYVFNLMHPTLLELSPDIRRIALIIILTRAGLSLNLKDLVKVGRPALLMTFVPATIEIMASVILGPILLGFSIVQSLIVGAILAAVSPAVIVPRMVDFIHEGRGVDRQIPQVILTGATADDIYVLVLFGAFTSLAVSGNFSVMSIIALPISIILAIIVGMLLGRVLDKLIDQLQLNQAFQIALLIALSLVLLMVEDHSNGFFSGMLAVITLNIMLLSKNPPRAHNLSHGFNQLWQVAEIFLFALVGMSLDPSYVVQAGITPVIFIALLSFIRLIVGVNLCLIGTPYTKSERLFMMVSYLPKATVQAAIGAVPLSMGISGGELMLTLAGLSILITAPIGALLIDNLAPKLLSKNT
ncbi:cation:proton antiporter [Aerococcaceae bacterium WGS1372]